MKTDGNAGGGDAAVRLGHTDLKWPSAVLALIALLVLPACNLVGGGEEGGGDAATEELSEVDRLTDELRLAKAQMSALETEVQRVKAEAASQAAADAAAAAEGRISLEKARLVAVKFAQENREVYGPDYKDLHLVWEVETAGEKGEFYYVYLLYHPFDDSSGTPGREEFIMDKRGNIEFRQVLDGPNPEAAPPPPAEGG